MHLPRNIAPHVASWRPPKRGPLFDAVRTALLQRCQLRLQAARNTAERVRMGGTFWVVTDGADLYSALHVADSLQALCTWARCPMPETTNKRAAP